MSQQFHLGKQWHKVKYNNLILKIFMGQIIAIISIKVTIIMNTLNILIKNLHQILSKKLIRHNQTFNRFIIKKYKIAVKMKPC